MNQSLMNQFRIGRDQWFSHLIDPRIPEELVKNPRFLTPCHHASSNSAESESGVEVWEDAFKTTAEFTFTSTLSQVTQFQYCDLGGQVGL